MQELPHKQWAWFRGQCLLYVYFTPKELKYIYLWWPKSENVFWQSRCNKGSTSAFSVYSNINQPHKHNPKPWAYNWWLVKKYFAALHWVIRPEHRFPSGIDHTSSAHPTPGLDISLPQPEMPKPPQTLLIFWGRRRGHRNPPGPVERWLSLFYFLFIFYCHEL